MDAMRGYHPRMLDIATQLTLKWERLNADDTVDVPADMTRLTLDTIALCGFDYRFNSFYRDTPHPFVLAMLNTLEAAQAVARELPTGPGWRRRGLVHTPTSAIRSGLRAKSMRRESLT
jgi:cytochrome P450 / NADPH-cytochrome P450 reductase